MAMFWVLPTISLDIGDFISLTTRLLQRNPCFLYMFSDPDGGQSFSLYNVDLVHSRQSIFLIPLPPFFYRQSFGKPNFCLRSCVWALLVSAPASTYLTLKEGLFPLFPSSLPFFFSMKISLSNGERGLSVAALEVGV